MTKVVSSQAARVVEASAVSLARYAAIINYPECAFWGVARDGDRIYDCREIWTLPQRNQIARHLSEAQYELENEIGYFLSPRYIVGALSDQPLGIDRYVDDQVYLPIVSARWPKVIEAGVRAVTDIALGAAVNHATDPVVIVQATSVTDPDEVYVYHPGTDQEINPSALSIAGGNVTITIPRCRMVKTALADNSTSGLDYTDTANFESTVDLKRVYTDPATNAELVSPHTCSSICISSGCSEHTQNGCIYVIDPMLGALSIKPATYSGSTWSSNGTTCCRSLTRVRLNYLSGMPGLTQQAEDAIVRLAHVKMPQGPCGCEAGQYLWRRDRYTPEILTRERINNRYGPSEGAWIAWQYAQDMKLWRGSVI